MRWVLAVNLAVSFYMTGLIWFVQIVHYPLFARVGQNSFAAYESRHLALTGRVVGPPMLLEAVTAILLVVMRPASMPSWAAIAGLALVVVIWCSTAFLQVPRHRELAASYGTAAHHALVATNWVRTLAWSVRSALLFWVVFREP